ncbi:autotransporter domain-containing protein [Bradyrhizobium mercantei]|uniref:autotransporter domain-containing protein n=1 Tax=Bradyrhizobium mercantei TaxID=1904807 RepID=UPI0009F8B719|nr:autotransporter domain-containing protein [Bradyrhizobium mercantei]
MRIRFAGSSRQGRSGRKTQAGVIWGLALSGLMTLVSGAQAQQRYDRMTVFGDSYAASSANSLANVQNLALYPSQGAAPSATNITFPYYLQSLLGISNSQVSNYAIGGATTQQLNVQGPALSFPYELARWNGAPFGPNELVAVNIGGNDALLPSGVVFKAIGLGPDGTGFVPAQASALATQATATTVSAVQQMASAGARNFMIGGFTDISLLPLVAATPIPSSSALYSQLYYQGLQSGLAPLAQSGVRIFLVDITGVMRQAKNNLAAYGLRSYEYVNAQTPSLFDPGGVHPTARGYEILAQYMANLVNAPDTIAAQADLSQIAINNFSGSIFQRLDSYRGFGQSSSRSAFATMGTADPGANQKAAATGRLPMSYQEQPFSVYVSGDYAAGKRDDRFGATGYSYEMVGGTVGAEYKIDRTLRVGGAFNYANPTADLNHAAGHINLNAFQFGAYASLDFPAWFSDFVVTYGRNDYQTDRVGIIDKINGRTDGNSFTAGFKSGYLFDVASVRMGPVVGINYARSSIHPYTETGDPLLTFSVSQPNLESLAASAGVQFRVPLDVGSTVVSPYLNITAEHDFKNGNRTLLSIESQAPLLPIYSFVPGSGQVTYGKVAGGISTQISDRIGLSVNGATTFAREGGNDFAVNGQLKIAFAAH